MAWRCDRDTPGTRRRCVSRSDHHLAAVRLAATKGVRERTAGELQELVHAIRRRVLARAEADRKPRRRSWGYMGTGPTVKEHLRVRAAGSVVSSAEALICTRARLLLVQPGSP